MSDNLLFNFFQYVCHLAKKVLHKKQENYNQILHYFELFLHIIENNSYLTLLVISNSQK